MKNAMFRMFEAHQRLKINDGREVGAFFNSGTKIPIRNVRLVAEREAFVVGKSKVGKMKVG